ncbi:uncharacterized protein ATC70_007399 [Mucor velutinosus]|uniref:GATA-type domain-containing protein n=1 Tax=Mucor velutinosus TaxID=708070 RepID=A0AAN7D2S6_9FUNG|nr:hypothetical protein ATC70_007399 [Mucor velutinosus]
MSSSGLIAARKRLENAIKKYDIPTESEPTPADKCKDGVLLLSLLQSRLNWTNAVFARYKTDPVQQPKRTSNTRRKWPNMKYLGTCTLQLGAHLYENTNFYEATRTDSWKDIAIKQGLMQPPPPPPPPPPTPAPPAPQVNPENKPDVVMQDATPQPESKPDVVMEEAEKDAVVQDEEKKDAVMEEIVDNQEPEASKPPVAVSEQSTASTTEAEAEKPQKQPQTPSESNTEDKTQAATAVVSADTPATTDDISKEPEGTVTNIDPQASTSSAPQQPSAAESKQPETQPEEIPDEKLTFVDIVFELKEFPNERFIFPKDAIIQSTLTGPNPDDCFIIASFVLPLDMSQTDEFFQKPKEKILKYGEMCQLPCISEYYRENTVRESRAADPPLPLDSYQPVNIRMTNTKLSAADALKAYVHKPEVVRKSMKDKMKYFPKRTYLKFDVSEDETRKHEIRELIKRASVAPDISTGPVQAEKKRNEILNAIRLGKRERDEKFESELPKNKMNARDDGFMKCAYCSTKQTSMWRSGPNGHGTLCNSCGLQWRQGEILVGAPVISPEEEKRLLKEKRERDKITEALELERAEKEEEKLKKKAERQGGSHHHHDISYTSGTFAAQLLQQRSRQRQANIPPAPAPPVPTIAAPPVLNNAIGAPVPATATPPVAAVAAAVAVPPPSVAAPVGTMPVANPASPAVVQQPTETTKKAPRARKSKAEASAAKKSIASAPPASVPATTTTSTSAAVAATPQQAIQTQPQAQPQQTQAQAPVQTQQQPAPVPLSLYNPAGIPLPTLSIDFAGHLQFAHPNCGITLLDRDFSVRLCKDGCEQTTVKFEKKDLTNAVFEVVTEGEAALKREVLKMKIVPATVKKITAFGKTMKIDKKNGVHIRFLEKLDPSGGAVVQRILQRWLVTEPQQ